MRDLLGFHAITLYEEYKLSPNPVNILSFDNIFFETKMVQGMIFEGKTSGILHNWTRTTDPGYKSVEKIAEGLNWYLMVSRD